MIEKMRERVIKNSGGKQILKPEGLKYTRMSSHEYPGQKIKITRKQLESGRVWKP